MTRAVAVLALVLATTGTLEAQDGAAQVEPWRDPEWRATVYLGEAFAAVTVCQFRPIIWTRDDLPPGDSGWVEAHERDHVTTMRRFRSCEAFFEWRNADPEHARQVEATAFCAGARWEYAHGRGDWFSLLWRHATMLGTYTWLGMTSPADGLAAMSRYCTGPT